MKWGVVAPLIALSLCFIAVGVFAERGWWISAVTWAYAGLMAGRWVYTAALCAAGEMTLEELTVLLRPKSRKA